MDSDDDYVSGPAAMNGSKWEGRYSHYDFEIMDWESNVEPPKEHVSTGVGLQNLGFTCYMNSVLQCLMHTVPFFQGIINHSDTQALICKCGTGEFCLPCSLRDLFQSYLWAEEPVQPQKLVDNLSYFSESFIKGQQNDAHEFLIKFRTRLLQCTDQNSQHDSLMRTVFGGSVLKKSKCCACRSCSENTEDFWEWQLPIKKSDNLISAILSYTMEKVDYTCETCGEKEGAIHEILLAKDPSVATFQLKRYGMKDKVIIKNEDHVPFPLLLDLLPFTVARDAKVEYELYAIIVHEGQTLNSGHYYSFIQVSPRKWFKFNDATVLEVTEEVVMQQKAYILFYARKGTAWFSESIRNQRAQTKLVSAQSPETRDDKN